MERRGGAAPLPYWGARALARRAADLAGSVMGASPAPWRFPSAPFPFGETENGTQAYPGPSTMRAMTLGRVELQKLINSNVRLHCPSAFHLSEEAHVADNFNHHNQ